MIDGMMEMALEPDLLAMPDGVLECGQSFSSGPTLFSFQHVRVSIRDRQFFDRNMTRYDGATASFSNQYVDVAHFLQGYLCFWLAVRDIYVLSRRPTFTTDHVLSPPSS